MFESWGSKLRRTLTGQEDPGLMIDTAVEAGSRPTPREELLAEFKDPVQDVSDTAIPKKTKERPVSPTIDRDRELFQAMGIPPTQRDRPHDPESKRLGEEWAKMWGGSVEIPKQATSYEDIIISTEYHGDINLSLLVKKFLEALRNPELKSKGMVHYGPVIQKEKEIQRLLSEGLSGHELQTTILDFISQIEEISKEIDINLKQILGLK